MKAVLRAGAYHPRTPDQGEGVKGALSRCKGGPERALLVVEDRICVGVKVGLD